MYIYLLCVVCVVYSLCIYTYDIYLIIQNRFYFVYIYYIHISKKCIHDICLKKYSITAVCMCDDKVNRKIHSKSK